jgi:hypothetical protein
MKIFFLIIITLHGLIHLLGFLKAFQLAEINQLTQNISKPMGILWLIALLLFLAAAIQFLSKHNLWWITGLAAVILSQVLIILFWQDAKFGTIPNIIILLVSIVAFADWSFNRNIKNEIAEILTSNPINKTETLTDTKIAHLPSIVQKWLKNSGAVGKEVIHTVQLKQKGEMKMKPEQEKWYASEADQYFAVDNPAFIWKVEVEMMPIVFFTGRDKFFNGKGSMLIKVLSLINVVNSSDDEKINQGTLQRYLGEIVWFPTAAVSPHVKWEEVDSLKAKATMTYKGTTGSGIFSFNENGDFVKFSTMRYMGTGDEAQLNEWTISMNEYKVYDGIKIPVKGEAVWKLDTGDFTWYKLEVYDVEYNKKSIEK